MASILTIIIIIFLVFRSRQMRSGQFGAPVKKKQVPQNTRAGADKSEWGTGFAEQYHEDPAAAAGMKGRKSAVPAAGRSAILEADGELDSMLAGRKRHTPGKDTAEQNGIFGAQIFGGKNNRSRLKDSSLFAGFEDRQNDWLARQLREEQRAKVRIMSDMMSLKVEHEKNHRRENMVIGR